MSTIILIILILGLSGTSFYFYNEDKKSKLSLEEKNAESAQKDFNIKNFLKNAEKLTEEEKENLLKLINQYENLLIEADSTKDQIFNSLILLKKFYKIRNESFDETKFKNKIFQIEDWFREKMSPKQTQETLVEEKINFILNPQKV